MDEFQSDIHIRLKMLLLRVWIRMKLSADVNSNTHIVDELYENKR